MVDCLIWEYVWRFNKLHALLTIEDESGYTLVSLLLKRKAASSDEAAFSYTGYTGCLRTVNGTYLLLYMSKRRISSVRRSFGSMMPSMIISLASL